MDEAPSRESFDFAKAGSEQSAVQAAAKAQVRLLPPPPEARVLAS
jgi:hypothetical protein